MSKPLRLSIGHLYPHSMNTYGDTGNITCLRYRAAARDVEVAVHPLEIGDAIPGGVNLYFFGGGQDAAQGSLGEDLVAQKGSRIRDDVAAGVPLLSICGGYQLLGASYRPFDQDPIPGVGLFPVETVASHDRMIGNIVIEADTALGIDRERRTIVGFENHSGKTTLLDATARPLGTVRTGSGNNGSDRTEGCVVANAIGCYLHGAVLPKNPHLADWLIRKALGGQDPDYQLPPLDDAAEWAAHDYAAARYR